MDIIFQAEKRCTGSFISSKHVITAAHCFIEEKNCYKEYVYKLVSFIVIFGKKIGIFSNKYIEKNLSICFHKFRGNVSDVFTNEGYTVHYGTHCVKIRDSGKCPNYRGKSIAIKHVGSWDSLHLSKLSGNHPKIVCSFKLWVRRYRDSWIGLGSRYREKPLGHSLFAPCEYNCCTTDRWGWVWNGSWDSLSFILEFMMF